MSNKSTSVEDFRYSILDAIYKLKLEKPGDIDLVVLAINKTIDKIVNGGK